ncbi:MAG: tetratricopeptide repeat protein [bacterium]
MKICPFISHLLGDENSNNLTLNNSAGDARDPGKSSDVVILGYNDGDDSNVQTGVMTKPEQCAGSGNAAECLKESCRFYQQSGAQCRFDLLLSKLADSENSQIPEIATGIDKIWQFQTKGVSEIVESLADSEKNRAQALAELKNDLDKQIETLTAKAGESTVEAVQKQMHSLREKLEAREEEYDGLSSTISEIVSNVDDGISEIKRLSDGLSQQVNEIAAGLPGQSEIKGVIEESLAKLDTRLKALDLTEPMHTLEERLEALQKKQEDASELVENKLLTSIENQKEFENRVDSWREELTSAVAEIKLQQSARESQIDEIVESNQRISRFIEEGLKHREDAQTRSNKKEAKKYNNLGVTSFHNGAYEMARDHFLKAVKLDTEFAEAYNHLGLAYTELELEEKATEAFERALELNPSLHATYNNLGYIHYKLGEYERAVEMYNEALGRNTKNGPAYTNLGNACYKLGRMDEARVAWTKALELDPGNEKARRNLERLNEENE